MTEDELELIEKRSKRCIEEEAWQGFCEIAGTHIREDVPRLVSAVRSLKFVNSMARDGLTQMERALVAAGEESARLRAFIEAHAFDACQCRESEPACIGCRGLKEPNKVDPGPLAHAPDCELVALLGREPKP